MKIRHSKVSIFFLNLFGGILFFIPLLLERTYGRKKLSSPCKILIIEPWGIGDLVIMSHILKPLKEAFPQSTITLLCKSYGPDVFKNNPYIDKFISFDFPWTRFTGKYRLWKWDWAGLIRVTKKMREEKFDLILDARGDFRNNLLSFFIGGKKRVGYGWTGGGYFLTDVVSFDYKDKHRVEDWANLLTYLSIDTGMLKSSIAVSGEEKSWTESFLRGKGIGQKDLLIGLHPGARIETRRWPIVRFAQVAGYLKDKYDSKILVFVEPDGYGEEMPGSGKFVKVKVPLRELMALIDRLDLFICNDGGPAHIAAALDTSTIVIFGPTNPVWFAPWEKNHSLIINNDIKCRPCFDYCRHKEPFCVTGISTDEVLSEVDRKIAHVKSIS